MGLRGAAARRSNTERSAREEQRLRYMRDYSAVMGRALELVIANHLESRTPIVLEGDFLLPSLGVQGGRSSTIRRCLCRFRRSMSRFRQQGRPITGLPS